MFLKDFNKPLTSKTLNETLTSKYGEKLDLSNYNLEQLMDARNKLRTNLKEIETTESYNSVQSEKYNKQKLLLDILNSEIDERGVAMQESANLNEGAEDEAELIITAKDMVDKLTGWMEDTSEMQSQSMLELADNIRDELGNEKSEKFTNMVSPSLQQLYSSMEEVRKTLINAVGILTGDSAGGEPLGTPDDVTKDTSMGDETLPGDDIDMDTIDTDMPDDFSATAPAAGGDEPAGRPRRESKQFSKKKV